MTTTTIPPKRETMVPVGVQTAERKIQPFAVWATLGALFLACAAYVWISWPLAGEFRRTRPGPTPLGPVMKTALVAWMVCGAVAAVAMIYFMLVRPWRRQGHITTDGLLVIAFLLVYWQDPLMNWLVPAFTYNAWLPNWGSWLNRAPWGEHMPNASRFIEPVVFTLPAWLWGVLGLSLIMAWIMRRTKAHFPDVGPLGLFLVAFTAGMVIDIVTELAWMRSGWYVYDSTIRSLTIFPNHYYRFPVYEAPIWGFFLAIFAALIYYRDDKGRTVVEKGIDRLNVTARRKTVLRFLAIVGFVHLTVGVYNLSMQPFAMASNGPPRDILQRSYFLNELCGPGTNYACSSKSLPIARDRSGHVDPSGQYRPARPGS